jgi:hypothetical protein
MSDLELLGSTMTQDPHDQWVPGLAPTHEISWKPTVSARAVNRLTVDYGTTHAENATATRR